MNNPKKYIILFFIKALLCYIVWFFVYDQWLVKVCWLDNLIIDNLVDVSKKILLLFHYPIFHYQHSLGIDGSHGVYIGIPCDAVELMALFASFIIIFEGKWIHKLWFIALGVVVIHLLNVVRVVALILMENYNPAILEFNHKYTFTILMYLVVFFGWVIWVKKFSNTKKHKN